MGGGGAGPVTKLAGEGAPHSVTIVASEDADGSSLARSLGEREGGKRWRSANDSGLRAPSSRNGWRTMIAYLAMAFEKCIRRAFPIDS